MTPNDSEPPVVQSRDRPSCLVESPIEAGDDPQSAFPFSLRRYEPRDEDAATALWLRTWQAAYRQIDFAARFDWWRERWALELVPQTHIVVAEHRGALVGFVTVDPATRYLDQIVVAPEHWGSGVATALLQVAKRLSPCGLDLEVNTDNVRAIRCYEKHGFCVSGAGFNASSGSPVHRMSWRP